MANSGDRSGFDRAQSEVTGTMLLLGVVAVVVTVAGGLLLAGYLDEATRSRPPVDLDAEVTATEVRLTHAGGQAVTAADVTVVLRQGGSESRSQLSTWTFERDDGDGRFEPSERATRSHGFGSGDVEVVVVHRPTDGVLLDEPVPVGTPDG